MPRDPAPFTIRSSQLILGGALFGLLGVCLAAAAATGSALRVSPAVPAATAFVAGSFLIAADGLLCAGLVIARVGGTQWWQATLNATLAILAGAACFLVWSTAPVAVATNLRLVVGFIFVLGAFPVLVLERTFAGGDTTDLGFLLRVPLLALLGVGLSQLLQTADFAWPIWVEQAVGALVLLVAIELLLRSLATAFMPSPSPQELHSVARSMLARTIPPAWPSPRGFNAALQRQLGIDLQRSWALRFAARASIPIGLAIVLLAWGITGVTALRIDQRAVEERFGKPEAVFGPGLHLHLPWPFGRLHPVEYGVLHDVAVSLDAMPTQTGPVVGAEDEPPPTEDRLWNGTHPGEATYVIASEEAGRQEFQIVNLDLRLIWRVGLSNQAAFLAVANDTNPESLVRSVAARVLVHTFSHLTLPALLSADRETLAATLQQQIRQELDGLQTGVDLVSVVIEAIHPPPAAASAYHAVQAATIRAQIAVADQAGQAADSRSLAQQTVTYDVDSAAGQAAATLAKARGDAALFAGDRQAYRAGGPSFLLERWFSDLTRALRASEMLIVDHRLAGGPAPSIDLRPPMAPAQTLPTQPHHAQSEPD